MDGHPMEIHGSQAMDGYRWIAVMYGYPWMATHGPPSSRAAHRSIRSFAYNDRSATSDRSDRCIGWTFRFIGQIDRSIDRIDLFYRIRPSVRSFDCLDRSIGPIAVANPIVQSDSPSIEFIAVHPWMDIHGFPWNAIESTDGDQLVAIHGLPSADVHECVRVWF